MIKFEYAQLTVSQDDGSKRSIVHETSLTLTEKRIALIGANGSGKSTIARMINGLIIPSSGKVLVQAGDTNFLDTAKFGRQVRDLVGFIFTDPRSQTVMPTPVEDVALSLRKIYKKKQERAERALEVLTEYGLLDQAQQSVHTLSGGQAQLLAIAAVLATDPKIVVADEPTTLLDLRNSITINKLLLALPQQLIVATHDLEFAQKCDRALLIENGHIVFDGDPKEAVTVYKRGV